LGSRLGRGGGSSDTIRGLKQQQCTKPELSKYRPIPHTVGTGLMIQLNERRKTDTDQDQQYKDLKSAIEGAMEELEGETGS
jgi:hypothetical protein